MSILPTHRPATVPAPTSPEENSTNYPTAASNSTPAPDAGEAAHETSTSQQPAQPTCGTPQPPVAPPPGHPLLADYMGRMPQIAIFRRFGATNALDLLYRQAEIVQMETQLRDLQANDAKTEATAWYARNSYFLSDDDSEQWKLFQELRVKLKEYSKYIT